MTSDERRSLTAWLKDYDDPSIVHDSRLAPPIAILVRAALDADYARTVSGVGALKPQAEAAIDKAAREDNTRCREQLRELQEAAQQLVEKSKEVAANVTMLEGTAFDSLRHVLIRQGVKVSRSPK